ncbi:MAG: hypothetical protein H6719_11665 [Sandaracinaceae bacterium]|nr:hypothetical protein [Sandaracinaceae bacterium]
MRRVALLLGLSLFGCEEPPAPPPPTPAPVPAPPPPAPPAPPERPGPTCSYHGWCWERPLPQGNDLYGVHVVDGEVVAVGERGTIVRRRGGAWAFEDAPTRERLRDVWGPSADALFAVGEAGTVLRYADGAWTADEGGGDADLWSVDGGPDGVVYAVGAAGAVRRWDGEAWTTEAVSTPLTLVDVDVTEHAVHALAVDLVGARAVLYRRGESEWVEVQAFDGDLEALLATDAGDVIVAGANARHRAADGTPSTEVLHLTRPVRALWGDGATAFAAGYDGALARWDGARWTRQESPFDHDLHALSGSGPDDVWAVGAHGVTLHWDGATWTRDGDGATAHLNAVWGLGPDDVWAVGDHAFLYFDGRSWIPQGPTGHDLRAIFGVGGVLLAAGDDGALLRYVGGAWVDEHRGSGQELNGLWGADVDHVFAVGKDVWLEREAGAWTEHADRPDAAGAWGSGPDDVWAAGRDGLHHWDGATWTSVPETASWVLFAVWGSAADDVWAVGAGGRVLHYDGAAWTTREAPTRQNLLALWGAGRDDVWAVGQHGTILHFDGERWRWRDSGTDELLHGVWGTGAGAVVVVGHGGTVLRFEGP